MLGQLEFGILLFFLLIVKNRIWKNNSGKWLTSFLDKTLIHRLEAFEHRRKIQVEFLAHVPVLRTLSGKKRNHLALMGKSF